MTAAKVRELYQVGESNGWSGQDLDEMLERLGTSMAKLFWTLEGQLEWILTTFAGPSWKDSDAGTTTTGETAQAQETT